MRKKFLSGILILAAAVSLAACADSGNQTSANESIVKEEETEAKETFPDETEIETELEESETAEKETEENVLSQDEILLDNDEIIRDYQIDDKMLYITEHIEKFKKNEEHHQIHAYLKKNEEVIVSKEIGDFYFYPSEKQKFDDYSFLVTEKDGDTYFLYQAMYGVEGPGVDYFLYKVTYDDLCEEMALVDPGYSDGRQLYDVTGVSHRNYYTEGKSLTYINDEIYQRKIESMFEPYGITIDDLIIRKGR